MAVGKSDSNTPTKQKDLERIQNTMLRAGAAILARYQNACRKFMCFDLNGGPGCYSDMGDLRGSPLITIDAAIRAPVPMELAVFEQEMKTYQSLVKAIQAKGFQEDPPIAMLRSTPYRSPVKHRSANGHPWEEYDHPYLYLRSTSVIACHLVQSDHASMFEQILDHLEESTGNRGAWCPVYGMVYSDENGAVAPFEFFRQIASRFRTIDILIHLSATSYKRMLASPNHPHDKMLKDLVWEIPKKARLIREPSEHDQWQWTFVLLTNWANGPVFRGFHNLYGPVGQSILDFLSFPRALYDQLPDDRKYLWRKPEVDRQTTRLI